MFTTTLPLSEAEFVLLLSFDIFWNTIKENTFKGNKQINKIKEACWAFTMVF
jgi:hypothetical protein